MEDDEQPEGKPGSGDRRSITIKSMILPGGAAMADGEGVAEGDRDLVRRIQHSLAHALDRPRDAFIAELRGLVAREEHEKAALMLATHDDAGIAVTARNGALVDALLGVEVDKLSDATRVEFVRQRAAIACDIREFVKAEPDLQRILADGDQAMSDLTRQRWRTALAEAAAEKGHRELALHRFQTLAASFADSTSPRDRAYVYGRVADLLPEGDPDGDSFAIRARDLYLMAGDRGAAVAFQTRRAVAVQRRDPRIALALLDEARALVTGDDLLATAANARIHHLTAVFLAERHEYGKAREAAAVAVAECRRLIGREDQLVVNLGLLAETEEQLGNQEIAERLAAEARALAEQLGDPWLLARETLGARIRPRGRAVATMPDLPVETEEHAFWRHVVLAIKTDDLEETLAHCDAANDLVGTCDTARDNEYLVRWIMGRSLANHGTPRRAIEHLKETLRLSPWTFEARNLLINLLWAEKRWAEAAAVLRDQIAVLGDLPGLNVALGRSLLEDGFPQDAVVPLTKCIRAGGPNTEEAETLLVRAVRGGAVPEAPRPELRADPTIEDLRAVLATFANTIANNQRMSFWRTDSTNGKRRWRENPEEHGKQLLMTCLATAFEERAEVLEETRAGAGRIDLYVRLGALRIVVELKMCGGGSYSTNYALGGLDQLTHYMEAKGTGLGFLVVFDARTRDFGKGLRTIETPGSTTIYVIGINVAPFVRDPAPAH